MTASAYRVTASWSCDSADAAVARVVVAEMAAPSRARIPSSTSVAVGAARGCLDLYEDILRTKKAPIPPYAERRSDPEFHHHFGIALSLVAAAEAALIRQGEEFMQACHDDAKGIAPFDLEREQRLALIALRGIEMAWEAIDIVYRTAGTSAAVKEGAPIGRFMRNVAAIRTHPILQLDRMAMNAARSFTCRRGLPAISSPSVERSRPL